MRFPIFSKDLETKALEKISTINPKSDKLPESFIYIDLESVEDGILIKEDKIELKDAPSRAQRLLKDNDILFQMVRPYQKNNLFFDKGQNYVASTGYAQIRALINPNYLFHYLHNDQFVKTVLLRCTGTSYPAINSTDLSTIPVVFPSLPEQQKIASFLTAIDAKIELLAKKKALLEQYKKGVMQQLFSQQTRFKDDDGNDFPEWEEKNGNKIFESVSDRNHNSDLPILAITQEYGAIPRNLIDFDISVTDKSIESYKVVQVGDFIISLRSFQGGIEYSKYNGICSPAYIILRPIVPINDSFFKYYFKTEAYIKELQRNLEGIRDGKMISYKYFSDIKLPVPFLPEQQKIVSFLNTTDAKINTVDQQLNLTKTYKKGLLQQLFV